MTDLPLLVVLPPPLRYVCMFVSSVADNTIIRFFFTVYRRQLHSQCGAMTDLPLLGDLIANDLATHPLDTKGYVSNILLQTILLLLHGISIIFSHNGYIYLYSVTSSQKNSLRTPWTPKGTFLIYYYKSYCYYIVLVVYTSKIYTFISTGRTYCERPRHSPPRHQRVRF